MKLIIPFPNEDPLDLLRRCGGYYNCPLGDDGKPRGPLVGYSKRYDDVHQFVGFAYADFAMAEEHPQVVGYCSARLKARMGNLLDGIDTFCGIPLGGNVLAFDLAAHCHRRYIFAEKEITELKTATAREQSRICLKRHKACQGERVAIVEDVCNNFDATDQIIAEVEAVGAEVVVILCFLNRSLTHDDAYPVGGGQTARRIPIGCVVRRPIPEHKQDAPEVAEEIAKRNVVWKPKDDWGRLMAAMAAAKS